MFATCRYLVCLVLTLLALCVPLTHAPLQAKEPTATPTDRTDPRPEWRAGNSWRLALTLSRPAAKDEHIEMHVLVTGTQKLDGHDCWRLEFVPIHAPAGFGSGYRVLLDKKDGVLRQVAPRQTPAKYLPSLTPGLPFPSEPPEGFPWEVLPFLDVSPAKPRGNAAEFRLTRRREKAHTWWEATIREEGDVVLVVKQKWADGGAWWSEYERWYEGQMELSASLVPAGQVIEAIQNAPPPKGFEKQMALKFPRGPVDPDTELRLRRMAEMPGEEGSAEAYMEYMRKQKSAERARKTEPAAISKPTPASPAAPGREKTQPISTGSELQDDPRLQAKVNLDLKDPSVEEVLTPLRAVTGVTLGVEEGTVTTKRPAFRSLLVHAHPAWIVMLQLADSQAVRGRWEQTTSGYRLIGTSGGDDTRSATPSKSRRWRLITLSIPLLIFLALVALRVRRSRQHT